MHTSHRLAFFPHLFQKTNVYDIVKREKLVITVSALKNIQVSNSSDQSTRPPRWDFVFRTDFIPFGKLINYCCFLLQERLVRQYTHKGKLHALTRDLNTYRIAAEAKEGEFDLDSDDDEWVS